MEKINKDARGAACRKQCHLCIFQVSANLLTSVTNCNHLPDASAGLTFHWTWCQICFHWTWCQICFHWTWCQIYFHWTYVPDSLYCHPVLRRLWPLLSLVVDPLFTLSNTS